jgi:hypothetical protein
MSINNPIETLFLSHKNVLSGFTHLRQVIDLILREGKHQIVHYTLQGDAKHHASCF